MRKYKKIQYSLLYLLFALFLFSANLEAQIVSDHHQPIGGGISTGESYSNFSSIGGVSSTQLLGERYVANVGFLLKTNTGYGFPGSIFAINYLAGSNGYILENFVQTVFYGGNSLPVEAIPDAGYRFVSWSDGVTDNPRTDVGVVGEINVTAIFEQNTESESINNKLSIATYPNPFTDVLYVNHLDDVSLVRIYDSRGGVVSDIKADNHVRSILINTSQLVNGVYLLKVLYNDGTYGLSKITKK